MAEPVFTHSYQFQGQKYEVWFFDKHLIWHQSMEPGHEKYTVVPYASIDYLEYATASPRPYVVVRVADEKIPVCGSEADMASIMERLTSVIV